MGISHLFQQSLNAHGLKDLESSIAALNSLLCSSFVVGWDMLLVEEASILEGHKAVCLDYNNFQVAVQFQSTFI